LQAPEPAIGESRPWQAEHRLLCEAVREAGQLALSMLRKGIDSWDKRDGTPVSEADLAVDKLLAERLLKGVDGSGWLSEETVRDDAMRSRPLVWIVDPIDGTSAFVSGTGHWCVGAALTRDGRPVAAAAYAPEQDRFYEAIEGGGARLNGETLKVSARTGLDGARIVAHRSVLNGERWLGGSAPRMHCAMTTSLILRHCLVATGEYDAAIAFGQKSDWDLAPGDLIVHEAGGVTRDMTGEPFLYNRDSTRQSGLLAGPAGLLDELGERLHSRR
jgi:myo-inositol-1(or 4)-monophosphatase